MNVTFPGHIHSAAIYSFQFCYFLSSLQPLLSFQSLEPSNLTQVFKPFIPILFLRKRAGEFLPVLLSLRPECSCEASGRGKESGQ